MLSVNLTTFSTDKPINSLLFQSTAVHNQMFFYIHTSHITTVLKANRDVKVCSLVEVKICPQYGLIKKFKMDLTKASRYKDPEYT